MSVVQGSNRLTGEKEKSGDFGNPGTKINLISCGDLNDPMSLDF